MKVSANETAQLNRENTSADPICSHKWVWGILSGATFLRWWRKWATSFPEMKPRGQQMSSAIWIARGHGSKLISEKVWRVNLSPLCLRRKRSVIAVHMCGRPLLDVGSCLPPCFFEARSLLFLQLHFQSKLAGRWDSKYASFLDF